MVALDEQSPDIAQGVDASFEAQHERRSDAARPGGRRRPGHDVRLRVRRDATELMPLPIELAHVLPAASPTCARTASSPYLRPDGKAQVTVRYDVDDHGTAAGRDRARARLDPACDGVDRRDRSSRT